MKTALDLGIKTPLKPYVSTALGASEVRLVELANAYRAMASGIVAEPHRIERVTDSQRFGIVRSGRLASPFAN